MPRRVLSGVVVSAKTEKTVSVRVERRFKHPKYHKTIKTYKKYAAHDELSACKEGQHVKIIECRPISKTKKWIIVTDNNSTSAE